jgi:hypothetical protein
MKRGERNPLDIKIGDLVKFKHHLFDGIQPIHLVTEVLPPSSYSDTVNIRLHQSDGERGIPHRASAFEVVRRAREDS